MPAQNKYGAKSKEDKAKDKTFYSSLLTPHSSRGFTLVEILVSIGIMALLTAVTIPNLREFSKNQELDNAASTVLNTLKTAQSSANSRITCPHGDISDFWTVRLTSTHFSLISHCQRLNTDVVISTNLYSADDKTAFSAINDRCTGETIDIIFSNSGTEYRCFSQTVSSTGDVKLTLSSGSLTKTVSIEKGGVIKVE